MYRVVGLLACIAGFLSLNGFAEVPVLKAESAFVNEEAQEAVVILSDTELYYMQGESRIRGSYTLKDGKQLEVSFAILGEKVVRAMTLDEKGLTTPSGTVLPLHQELPDSDRAITKRIIEKENAYTKVSMNFMGDYLGDHYKDKKLVVLVANFGGDETRDKMEVDALKAGLDGRLKVEVVKIGVDPNAEGADAMMMGPDGMVTAAQFNEAMAKHKDAGVFLSLVGLPMDFTEMTFWTLEDDERPVLALAYANIYMLRKAIQKGFVGVVLQSNPEAVYDPNAEFPKDPMEAFNNRYILIHSKNVDAIAEKYPELFKAEPKKR